MSLGSYLVGLAVLAAVLGFCVVGSVIAERRWLAVTGASQAVATGVLTTFAILLVHLLPGLAGVLSRWSVLLTALAIFAAVALVARRRRSTQAAAEPAEPAATEDRRSLLIAGLGVGIVSCFLLASFYVYARGGAPPTNLDALSFHLPGVGRWIQTQSVWSIDQFIPGIPTGEYPQNGDLVLLAAMLPWRSAAFAQLANYPFLALLALAVYAGGRELGAPRAPAALVAAAVLAIPAVYVPVTEVVMVDAPGLACFAAGGLFLLRHRRAGRASDLVLAGIALGIAMGTKWYGVSAAAVVIGIWLLCSLRTVALRRLGSRTAVLVLVALVAGGVWMLRNWVEVGNPLYPARVSAAGVSVFSAPAIGILDKADFSIAHYATDGSIWRHYLLPAWWGGYGAVGAAFAAGAIGIAAAAIMARRGRRSLAVPGSVLACVAAAALIALAYIVTPGSAAGVEGHPGLAEGNSRYGVAALIAVAPAIAWGLGRLRRWAIAAQLGLLGAIVAGVTSHPGSALPRAAAIAVAVALLCGLIWHSASTASPRSVASTALRHRAALAAGLGLAVAIAGFLAQRNYEQGLYRGIDPAFDEVLAVTPPDHNVGIAGRWSTHGYAPVWPMFGPRLENSVAYVGPERDGVLRQYDSRAAFTRALHAAAFDFLVVGRGLKPRGYDRYVSWAKAAGYRRVTKSRRLVLLRNSSIVAGES